MKQLFKLLCRPFLWLWNLPGLIKRRILLMRMYIKLERAYQRKLVDTKQLRAEIDTFLIEFFGLKGRSKFIPHSFKNNEQVKEAVEGRFGERMNKLSLNYTDLWK